jgi:hypothetical protein
LLCTLTKVDQHRRRRRGDLPLLAPLPIATLESITLGLSEHRYDDLEEIVIQGELGDSFFVIDEGHVQVEVDAVAPPQRLRGAGRRRRSTHRRRHPRAGVTVPASRFFVG